MGHAIKVLLQSKKKCPLYSDLANRYKCQLSLWYYNSNLKMIIFSLSCVILKAMWPQKQYISAVTNHENRLNLRFLGIHEPTWWKDDIGVERSLVC